MIITLTGHRDIANEDLLSGFLIGFLGELTHFETLRVRWGGAPGADIIFAEAAHTVGVPMDLYLPDPYYEERYIKNGPWQKRFGDCWSWSENVHYSAETNDWRNNFARNVDMFTGADVGLAAYKYDDIAKYTANYRPRNGGTSHGIMTALKLGFRLGDNLIHVPV